MMDGKQTKAVIGQTLITLCETKEVNKISVQESIGRRFTTIFLIKKL